MYKGKGIAITGIGIISPAGCSGNKHWESIKKGNTYINSLDKKLNEYMPFQYGSIIEDFNIREYLSNNKLIRNLNRGNCFAFAAAGMAIKDAGISNDISPEQKGLFFLNGLGYVDENDLQESVEYSSEGGCFSYDMMGKMGMKLINPMLPLKALPNMGLGIISIHYGFEGDNLVASPFSSETAMLLREAVFSIERGQSEICLVGAADAPFCVSSAGNLIGYTQIQADGRKEERFSNIVLSEGAVFIVLESLEKAVGRGQHIYGVLGEMGSYNIGEDNDKEFKISNILERYCIHKHEESQLLMSVYDRKKEGRYRDMLLANSELKKKSLAFSDTIGYMASSQALLDICHACFVLDDTYNHGITIVDCSTSGGVSVIDVRKPIG